MDFSTCGNTWGAEHSLYKSKSFPNGGNLTCCLPKAEDLGNSLAEDEVFLYNPYSAWWALSMSYKNHWVFLSS